MVEVYFAVVVQFSQAMSLYVHAANSVGNVLLLNMIFTDVSGWLGFFNYICSL